LIFKLNNIDNLDVINGDAAIEFEKLIKSDIQFDVSVTDPPRKGCTSQSIDNLVKLTKKYIVYVSCNVSTLARDMKMLNDKGFKTIFIQPADLFPNTYHVETIALFEKF
jgi:23S rRNA (uracil1939-C5)-methyltransferase